MNPDDDWDTGSWWDDEWPDEPQPRPVVTVELPPFDEGTGVPVLRDGGAQ